MSQGLNIIILMGLGAVILILGLGLWNMFRGGDPNLSQKLMRYRIVIQAVVIVVVMAALFFFSPKG